MSTIWLRAPGAGPKTRNILGQLSLNGIWRPIEECVAEVEAVKDAHKILRE